MAQFDPQAATAAYLAQLPPEGHIKAIHYTQGGHWLLLWGFVVTVVVSLIILKTGVLNRLTERLEKDRARPWLVAWLCSVLFLAMSWILSLPWESYASWYRPKTYGLQNQTWFAWFGEGLIGLAVTLIMGGIFLAVIYWVIRKWPRFWPVLAGVVTAVFVLIGMTVAPVLIEPLFNKYTPAPQGPVRELVVQMGQKVGVPTDKIFIFNGSKQSNAYTANVAGMFGTARVAMSDTMFAKGADQAEVKGVVGHEMGHYVHQHGLWLAAGMGLLTMLMGWLTQAIFPTVQRLMGGGNLGGIADPAALPVLVVAFSLITLLATPLQNTLSRAVESDADSFSLQNFDEPDGLAKALVKTIEYRADSPSKLEEVFFYDHPSVRARVEKAMNWKAAHLKPGQEAVMPAVSSAAPAAAAAESSSPAAIPAVKAPVSATPPASSAG
jgi:STE24 endopeptidase